MWAFLIGLRVPLIVNVGALELVANPLHFPLFVHFISTESLGDFRSE